MKKKLPWAGSFFLLRDNDHTIIQFFYYMYDNILQKNDKRNVLLIGLSAGAGLYPAPK